MLQPTGVSLWRMPAADDDMIAVIDGISGMSVRYLDATSSSESSGITTAGSIVSADENKFLELASGHRATKQIICRDL